MFPLRARTLHRAPLCQLSIHFGKHRLNHCMMLQQVAEFQDRGLGREAALQILLAYFTGTAIPDAENGRL